MRNLKRTLSLVLAAAMLVGMMVVGASAAGYDDFTDKGEIVNTEAVSTLVQLGVINGKEDGSYFDPAGIVTRAEMAKMITVALHGGKDPVLGVKDKPSFSDIKGTWAESYIEYCTSDAVGIISGRGNGKFDPTATVTAAEAAKMLLTALGYDADVFGLTGANWQINTDVYANQAKLYDDLAITSSAQLTRDNAAQMIYNALQAYMMIKTYDKVLSDGTISYSYGLSDTKTLLSEKFGVVKVTGIVTGNEFADLNSSNALAEGKTEIVVDASVVGINTGAGTFKVSSGEDVLGRAVTLYVKPAKGSTAAANATVVGGVVLADSNKVVTVTDAKTAKEMTDLLDDENLAAQSSTKYIANYETGTSAILTSNVAGVELTLVDNDGDGKLDYVLQFAKTFGKVVSYSTTGKGGISVSAVNRNSALTGTLASVTSTDAKDKIIGYDTVAKDDYVLFYTIDGQTTVEKVEPIEASLSSIKGDKVVAGGVTYAQSGLVTGVDGSNQALKDAVVSSLGKNIKIYVDGGNNVCYVTDVDSTINFLYVVDTTGWNTIDNYARTKVVLSDGTSAVVNAYVKSGATKTSPSPTTVYSYTESDGTYELTAIGGDYSAANIAAGGTITKGNASVASATANAKTVFVVKEGDSWNVYTGISNVPSMTGVTATGVQKSGTVSVLFVTTSSISGASKSIYVINANPTVTKDGNDNVYTYDVVFEGAYTQLSTKSATIKAAITASGLYTGAGVNGSELTGAGSLGSGATKATKASDGLIAATGGSTYTYDEKTVFVVVDASGETADEMVQSVTGVDGASFVVIDSVNAANTSNIIIVPGSAADSRTTVADYVYIVK